MKKIRLNKYINKKKHIEIILTNRSGQDVGRVLIDKKNVNKAKICRWGLNNTTKTTQGFINGKLTTMHQFLLGKKTGFVIDHKNGNPLDNRMTNLRYATKSQNAMNQKNVFGITYLKFRPECPNWKKRWLAQIQFYGKKDYKYCYSKEEALLERRKMELKYFKKFAK